MVSARKSVAPTPKADTLAIIVPLAAALTELSAAFSADEAVLAPNFSSRLSLLGLGERGHALGKGRLALLSPRLALLSPRSQRSGVRGQVRLTLLERVEPG